jgi:hypothetical protein
VGNFQVCDAISVVNGQAAYTLQVGGANVAPESANHMLVSLNGILQKPGSSFTISGSTITFASNLATGDVIDFVQILGNNFTKLGTGLTNSSGIFSFPSTGYYYVIFQANFNKNGDRRGIAISINLTEDNSSFTAAATGSAFIKQTESDATTSMATCSTVVHCDDVSNVKISFSAGGTSTNTLGNTNAQETGFTVFKLAET